MKTTTTKLILVLMITLANLLISTSILAQQAATAAGGNATGSGGTVAYSVGQVAYTTNTGATNSVAQGVQQPYEISGVVGIKSETNSLTSEIKLYPNPTINSINLQVVDYQSETLFYELMDVNGKLIETKKINSTIETISMADFAAATYFLRVTTSNSKEVKSFKIIKH